MTTEEIRNLAKWTAQLWKLYQECTQTVMNQWDFDRLVDEVRKIYEASGCEPVIFDVGMAFMNDIERRQLNASKECCNT